MDQPKTLTYEVDGRVARITLNRPHRGNGITLRMPRELAACVEQADLDPRVHVIALSGNGKGFCGGYDLVASAERLTDAKAPQSTIGAESTVLDGIARHTPEGYASQQCAAEAGFKTAVHERDAPFE